MQSLQGLSLHIHFPSIQIGCSSSLPHVLMGVGTCRVDAGKVELDGAQYLGFRIPLTISQLVWIEAILVGGAEIYRNRERDPETRLYPGESYLQQSLLYIKHLIMHLGSVWHAAVTRMPI